MTAPYTAPPGSPAPPRQRRRGGVVWPLILIFLGGVFLLQNLGYLPPTFWTNLWRLWPLVLVLVGAELLLAHRVPWLALAALALGLLLVGTVVINTRLPAVAGINSQAGSAEPFTTSAQTSLGGATQAALNVRFGAGQLNVGALNSPQGDQLATMNYSGPQQLAPEPHYSVSNGVGQLDFVTNGRPGPSFPFPDAGGQAARMDLQLAPNIPINSFAVQTGATDAHIDLSQLQVKDVNMSIGAATAWLRFPEAAGLTTAHISGGASTITVEIPPGVAAQIEHQGGLSTLNVDQSRFPQVSDSLYRSPDYATAQNKVDLTIETGVTTIQIS